MLFVAAEGLDGQASSARRVLSWRSCLAPALRCQVAHAPTSCIHSPRDAYRVILATRVEFLGVAWVGQLKGQVLQNQTCACAPFCLLPRQNKFCGLDAMKDSGKILGLCQPGQKRDLLCIHASDTSHVRSTCCLPDCLRSGGLPHAQMPDPHRKDCSKHIFSN